MAKRMTDSGIWRNPFFRALPPAYKSLWRFITDDCDHAGIWNVDFEIAELLIGLTIEETTAVELFGDRIVVLDGGLKWFIPSFIEFQYNGYLNPKNNTHNSVIKILAKNGIDVVDGYIDINSLKQTTNKPLNKPLPSPSSGALDKDKDKERKRGVGEKTKKKDFANEKHFQAVYELYPKKIGKKEAFRHYKASVKTEQDYLDIQTALKNYKLSSDFKKGFICNASTFFNNWQDWLNYQEHTETAQANTQAEKAREADQRKQRINKLFSGVIDAKKIGDYILDNPIDEQEVNERLKDAYPRLIRSVADYVKKERDKFSSYVANFTGNIGKSVPADKKTKTPQQFLNEYQKQKSQGVGVI